MTLVLQRVRVLDVDFERQYGEDRHDRACFDEHNKECDGSMSPHGSGAPGEVANRCRSRVRG